MELPDDPRADLHLHTTASDGALTPTEAVEAASKMGLTAIGVTDHDTVAGIDEALAASAEFGVEVVPGVEISTLYAKTEAHILGYYMDHHDPELLATFRSLTDARYNRGRMIVEKLNSSGVALDFSQVEQIAQGGAIGRPHVARAMVEAGIVGSMDGAFGKYLCEGGPGYVERFKVTPAEAVRIIQAAGGVACVAHVAKLKRDELIAELMEIGLVGIEASHPDHAAAGTRFYKRFAAKRGLIATGGSDAHCLGDPRRGGIGSVTVSYDVVLELKKAAGRLRDSETG